MPSVGNSNLQNARANEDNNEYYTKKEEIEKELIHYEHHFEDKIVYCNCDDPFESNFFKYFIENFYKLKLKELICTCYKGSPVVGEDLEPLFYLNKPKIKKKQGYKIDIIQEDIKEIFGETDIIKLDKVKEFLEDEKQQKKYIKLLKGDGDFRSEECEELLKRCDIVVTNPPFKLFRDYIQQIMDYEKKFLVIGNKNAVSYKEIFKCIIDKKIWLGVTIANNFLIPQRDENRLIDTSVLSETKKINGLTRWFTNLEHEKLYEPFNFTKTYKGNEKYYPEYADYKAINVKEVQDIPSDYKGIMGVPITFLDSYNEVEFEIIDCCEPCIEIARYKQTGYFENLPSRQKTFDEKLCQKTYHRLLIKRKDNTSLYPKEDKAELKRIEKEAENLAQNEINEEKKKEKKEIIIEQRLPLDNNLKKRILLRANYKCENEFCTKPRPFKKEDKTTYLEFHHIIPYCECRKHEYENIVALCPNCHKQIHFGEKAEIETIKNGLEQKIKNYKKAK